MKIKRFSIIKKINFHNVVWRCDGITNHITTTETSKGKKRNSKTKYVASHIKINRNFVSQVVMIGIILTRL